MKKTHLKKIEGYAKKIKIIKSTIEKYMEEIDEIHSIATDEFDDRSEAYQDSEKGLADSVRLDAISEIVDCFSTLNDDIDYLIDSIYEATTPE